MYPVLLLFCPVKGFPEALLFGVAEGFDLPSPRLERLVVSSFEDLGLQGLEVQQVDFLLEAKLVELALRLGYLGRLLVKGSIACLPQCARVLPLVPRVLRPSAGAVLECSRAVRGFVLQCPSRRLLRALSLLRHGVSESSRILRVGLS